MHPPAVHITLSPTLREVTLGPTCVTIPEHSIPTKYIKQIK